MVIFISSVGPASVPDRTDYSLEGISIKAPNSVPSSSLTVTRSISPGQIVAQQGGMVSVRGATSMSQGLSPRSQPPTGGTVTSLPTSLSLTTSAGAAVSFSASSSIIPASSASSSTSVRSSLANSVVSTVMASGTKGPNMIQMTVKGIASGQGIPLGQHGTESGQGSVSGMNLNVMPSSMVTNLTGMTKASSSSSSKTPLPYKAGSHMSSSFVGGIGGAHPVSSMPGDGVSISSVQFSEPCNLVSSQPVPGVPTQGSASARPAPNLEAARYTHIYTPHYTHITHTTHMET